MLQLVGAEDFRNSLERREIVLIVLNKDKLEGEKKVN